MGAHPSPAALLAAAVFLLQATMAARGVPLAGSAAALTAPLRRAPCSPDGHTYWAGELTLHPGDSASYGNATLLFTTTGDLQIIPHAAQAGAGATAVAWHTNTSDSNCTAAGNQCEVCFQGDGNFVLHGSRGQPMWGTETWENNLGSLLFGAKPPFLTIFDGNCTGMWWTSPGMPPPPKDAAVARFPAYRPFRLAPGSHIDIRNVSLVFTTGGNIQVNDTGAGAAAAGWVLWSANTSCPSNCSLDWQGDGNWILHECGPTGHCHVKWATWTYNENLASLVLQDTSPYLQIVDQHGAPVWTDLGKVGFVHNRLGGIYPDEPPPSQGRGSRGGGDDGPVITVTNVAGPVVAWAVYDYHYRLVDSGSAHTNASNALEIRPRVRRRGYYDVVVGGAPGNTSFAFVVDNEHAFHADSPFGTCTHFGQGVDPITTTLIRKLGVKHIRDNAGLWEEVEQAKGIYNFSKHTGYMDVVQAAGLAPTLIAAFSNVLYVGGTDARVAPFNATSYAGYANYCTALVKQYPWMHGIEIWNEYIGSFVDGIATTNRSLYYTGMIKAAAAAVRKQAPKMRIAGGAAEDIPLPTFDEMMRLGLLDSLDALVIHPYGYSAKNHPVIPKLARLHESMAQHGGDREVWATEWSLQTKDTAEERRAQAAYAVRFQAQLLASNVTLAHYFMFNDFQSWPRGFVRNDNSKWGAWTVTPAYTAFGFAINALYGTEFVGEETRNTSDAFVLHFRNTTHDVRVLWGAGDNASVAITLPAAGPVVLDIEGNPIDGLLPLGRTTTLSLPAEPLYILGPVTAIQDLEPVPLADSFVGFSFTQGAHGWHYGYFEGATASSAGASSEFKPMTTSSSEWVYFWVGPEPYCRIIPSGGVPGNASRSVRRWVAPASLAAGSAALVVGELRKPSGGGLPITGTVYHNGVVVGNQTAQPAQQVPWNVSLPTLKAGDTLDFALSGDGATTVYPVDDHSVFTARILPA